MSPLHSGTFWRIGVSPGLAQSLSYALALSGLSLLRRLAKTDVDIIISAYREFYESVAKGNDSNIISAYQQLYESLAADGKAKAAEQGEELGLETATAPQGALPHQTVTTPQRVMSEEKEGMRPQRAMSKQEAPAAQQKKASFEEEGAPLPQPKLLSTQETGTQPQQKAPQNKPAHEANRAEEKQAAGSRKHSKEQASAKAGTRPQQNALEAAREALRVACEQEALQQKELEAAREGLRVSLEQEALREAERAEKKRAKKARQRAIRAQAVAQNQPAQQEVGQILLLLPLCPLSSLTCCASGCVCCIVVHKRPALFKRSDSPALPRRKAYESCPCLCGAHGSCTGF